jgi:hypothetical protein
MKSFKASNRNQPFLLPPSIQDWLPQEHLARFIVETVEQLDLSKIESRDIPEKLCLNAKIIAKNHRIFS